MYPTDEEEILYNHQHRILATRRVTLCLRQLGDALYPDYKNRQDPVLWLGVMRFLGIAPVPVSELPNGSIGELSYDDYKCRWCISFVYDLPPYLLARVLVHELAHYLLRDKFPVWLCDVNAERVFHYEGPVDSEHHKIASHSEQLVVGKPKY